MIQRNILSLFVLASLLVSRECPGETGVVLPEFPDRDFLITDFGAHEDGISLNTDAFNRAIEACNEAGGGRVVIPGGLWVTGPIRLLSHVNLHAEAGAVVLFTTDFDQYPYVRTYFEGQLDYRAMPLLFGDSIENIAITGEGIFDGSGQAWRPVKKSKCTPGQWRDLVASGGTLSKRGDTWWPNEYAYEASRDPRRFREILWELPDRDKYKAFYRPPLVQLVSCDRVLLEGPVFQNSPGWCIHPLMCSNLTVDGISVRNPWYAQNGDGIDVESCSHVSIRNSHFDVGDDAICIKSGRDEQGRKRGMPTEHMEVDNCVVHHGHGGFVVGSEMSGGVRDIRVSNCTFLGTDVGLRFKSTRGRGGVVEDIHIENIRMVDIARDAIIFNLFYAGMEPTAMGEDPVEGLLAHAPEVSEETPEFRNITISGISCQGARQAMRILGLPEMPVSGLQLDHCVFRTRGGISCLFASGLSITDVKLVSKQGPGMVLNNVTGAKISSFKGNQDVLFRVEGSTSSEISTDLGEGDLEEGRIVFGEKVAEGAVRFKAP
jgi:polygalacturonase